MAAKRVRVEFAGVSFSGFAHGADHVTVPVNVFWKILRSGKVKVTCSHDIEHDGNGQYDRYNVKVRDAAAFAEREQQRYRHDRPWLLYLDLRGEKPAVRYCPHSNLGYDIVEGVEEVPTRPLTKAEVSEQHPEWRCIANSPDDNPSLSRRVITPKGETYVVDAKWVGDAYFWGAAPVGSDFIYVNTYAGPTLTDVNERVQAFANGL